MNIKKILKTREDALYYDICEYKENCNSWVGGNAPKILDNISSLIWKILFLLNPAKPIK